MAGAKNVWIWLMFLYFAEGLPNVMVSNASVAFYTTMGMSLPEMARLTSLLYLPWALKAFWSPAVEALGTRRSWILLCISAFSFAFLLLSIVPFSSNWALLSAALFWIIGFSSATFDIAADGFYMCALDEKRQAFFVGIRNSFYRLAVLFAQGALLVFAGYAARKLGGVREGWSAAFGLCAATSILCAVMLFVFLPRPDSDKKSTAKSAREFFAETMAAFSSFFARRGIFYILFFILFYRFAESQLVKMVQPFLLAPRSDGGLGLSLESVGLVYGVAAPIALFGGGILGGIAISKKSLKGMLWTMALFMNVPNIVYVYLAFAQPQNIFITAAAIVVEQFGYGFGFAGYMMFLIFASRGAHKTSHYAICTAFMALGLMLPGAISGDIYAYLGGYGKFFLWVLVGTLVSFIATAAAYKSFGTSDFAK